jgi:hypothetical protein
MKFYVVHSPTPLKKKDFNNFCVWCEWHTPEENEYIQEQLESEEQMRELFWTPYEKGINCDYPIRELKNLPYREFLYIAAEIDVPGCGVKAGYVSIVANEVVSASIWTNNDEEIIFYRSDRLVAEEENIEAVNSIRELFNIPSFNEIKYKTDYLLSNNVQVSGSLELNEN